MTQEDRELLLKDLCARLPYGVKCNVWYGHKSPALNEKDKYTDDILETINPQKGNCTFHNAIGYDFGFFPVEYVKPYLRPMSSMTEEEFIELKTYTELKYDQLELVDWNDTHKTIEFYLEEIPHYCVIKIFDWLNSHHFDYRGLIPKGLSLEAKEGMYN